MDTIPGTLLIPTALAGTGQSLAHAIERPYGTMGVMESYQPRRGRLTAEQTATLLGITRENLRLLVHRRKLRRVGGSPRRPEFDVAEVTALQAAREERSGGPPLTQVRGNSA